MTTREGRAQAARPPRTDALQNRARILAAAHARFAADGLATAMDDIARDAGVAVGTLYHHFGNKDALLEAVVSDGLGNVALYLQTLLREAEPWEAVERLLYYMAERQIQDRAFKELIGAQPTLRTSTLAAKRALGSVIQQILERAQQAGELRADVVASDIPLLLAGLAERESTPAAYARYLDIILRGLRTASGPNPTVKG